MLCSNCAGQTDVIDSRRVTGHKIAGQWVQVGCVRRRRVCLMCAHRETTYEFLGADLDKLWSAPMEAELRQLHGLLHRFDSDHNGHGGLPAQLEAETPARGEGDGENGEE